LIAPPKNFIAKLKQAGKKEGGVGEMNFCPPARFCGWWVCVAAGDAQVNQNFAQKGLIFVQ
jgi:hypothetical protein